MWEIFLDALKDSAIVVPFLLAIYLLIEFLERNQRAKNRTVRLLNGKVAPLVAGGVGLIPQCGFSVMATDLYCQNYLKLGTLIAFFVATSDEALPILITNLDTVKVVWIVLLVKIVYAVALGYLINLCDRRVLNDSYTLTEDGCCHHHIGHEHDEHDEHEHNENFAHEYHESVDEHDERKAEHQKRRSKHSERLNKFWGFVKHPLLHTVKIFLYIFVVNSLFGILLHYAEQPIMEFAAQLGFFQSFFTAIIGLIPNCASSVIVTGMYTKGIVSFSAMLAGLVSNSGIALAILFKQRKWKRNFLVLGIMYSAGVVLGVAGYALELLFV